jgi:hypothetical protein
MQENNTLKLPQMCNQQWCLKNELQLNRNQNLDNKMSLSQSKCWYSNNWFTVFKVCHSIVSDASGVISE